MSGPVFVFFVSRATRQNRSMTLVMRETPSRTPKLRFRYSDGEGVTRMPEIASRL
jgi:hypothetical protein